MRRFILICAFVATLLVTPTADAQDATPSGTPLAAGPLLQSNLEQLPLDRQVIVGVIRTTYQAGGQVSQTTGAAPFVLYVESGSLVVRMGETSSAPRIVHAGGTPPAESDGDEELTVAAGDALIVSAENELDIRNEGSAEAATLTLLSADNAEVVTESEVSHAILVRLVTTLPTAPLTVTLNRVTLAPAEKFPLPPAPTVTVLAVVERSQAFSLSGDEVNRGKEPIDLYVLSFTPTAS